ncbi:RNA-binding region-containing protein 3 [Cylas formicarius]|uniref:RNA-binding region-containing protein 3 n=1 Tax=Cylas formicarius TaxID=197179 RepID=UPI002958BF66|nr:RNA-binding region-containing protein 3 [Cylas formicarius]
MAITDTLRIKNLPKELSEHQKEDFARHFGAVKVKVLTSKAKEKAVVYAKFESPEMARSVMHRLHQISVLNSRLCVEYAENGILHGKPALKKVEEADVSGQRFFKTFLNKINAFNDSAGFHQPPPSHLKYNYPKANRATINNIAHALATVPRFYVQVLHLMNKMNLPPPFAVPEPPIRTITPLQQHHPVVSQKPIEKRKASSSESELESDDESRKPKEIIPEKRPGPEKKPVKRPKFIKAPAAVRQAPKPPPERVENVFEKTATVAPPKKIELKVTSESLAPAVEERRVAPELDEQSSPEDDKPCISLEELAANQITDLAALPIFKNYAPGPPTNKLYIKNCAKTVVLQDLEYIYNRYREEGGDERPSEFNIRLMQEGRMKGQAFVTLDTVEMAQKAVKETNGFILKDKPLVVVFGKSATLKK